MNEIISDEERRKREDRERKKAEVRARLEAQTSTRAAKRGFMTGERKKALRVLLRRKAAEELKRQQEAKAAQRRQVIAERAGNRPNLEAAAKAELAAMCNKFHERLRALEDNKWDLEQAVGRKELEIHQLSSQVGENRGKFVKPPLKRVPRYEQKIERMLLNARKEVGFTVNLKAVKRDQFKVEEPRDSAADEPEWSWKKSQREELAEPAGSAN